MQPLNSNRVKCGTDEHQPVKIKNEKTYTRLNKHIDKMIFIIVTNEATTAIVTTFLLSSFDDVWAFGTFVLLFFVVVENLFVVTVEFCVIRLFEVVLLVEAEDWLVLSSFVPVTGAWVFGTNRVIGS